MAATSVVVKVGGSLFDLPDLGPRLGRWLAALGTRKVLIVPGGGPTADVVRNLDRWHHLGEEHAHWLALHALSLNARFLASLLPRSVVVPDVADAGSIDGDAWRILDAHDFARRDEARAGHLPHSWEVTSDSIAARAASITGAARLFLLKSVSLPPGVGWRDAEMPGIVDRFFAEAVGPDVSVRVVNFRQWQA